MADNRNMFLAVGLSLAVIIIWQFFFIQPQMEEERAAQQAAQIQAQQNPTGSAPGQVPAAPGDQAIPGVPQAPAAGDVAVPAPTAAIASAESSARVKIQSPMVTGSIRLIGGRLDDLHLKDYHVTVDPSSPTVTLLAPAGSAYPYFVETGWVATGGAPVPDSNTEWTLEQGETLTPDTPITLVYDTGAGIVYRRTIEVDEHYLFTVRQTVENNTDAEISLYPYSRVRRTGLEDHAQFFILHEGYIGVIGEEGLVQEGYSGLEDDPVMALPQSDAGWLGLTDKYWATAVIPDPGKSFTPRFLYDAPAGAAAASYQADYLAEAVTVAPGATGEAVNRVFAGAKKYRIIQGYEDTVGVDRFNLMIDWGWFYFITKPMFFLLEFIYSHVGNFGVAILIATVVVKLIFFPLAQKAYKSMAKMKGLQPEMTKMRERYKDDRMKQQQAMMELYKKEKVNPLAGCIPILIQIPVFFALYKVLFVSIEMRHAPFFGWIDDLSAPDPTSIFNLFGLIPFDPSTVPFVGAFLMVGVWPLIMGFTMWVQMKMNPAPPDPTQAMIFNWMPVFFTFLLASFPAGLVIYWAWNNSLSVLQQYVIMRRQGVKVELWDNLTGVFKKKQKKGAT
ncbi:membrane protein insertase YidC [Acuticoccus sp. MNP-M23]|uniref:membrane protein insertase YidC n=1 Tax=Acuticoccus sp. MNP-M23 TaxID=3072793 RepID=UPI0028167DE7|nr:membrane protein insertase YidC [Acuticoccus sp. MNP-M23]WMS42727.1 membrane protein insertase YidC [Acuticoccus sp. MNP-M23]